MKVQQTLPIKDLVENIFSSVEHSLLQLLNSATAVWKQSLTVIRWACCVPINFMDIEIYTAYNFHVPCNILLKRVFYQPFKNSFSTIHNSQAYKSGQHNRRPTGHILLTPGLEGPQGIAQRTMCALVTRFGHHPSRNLLRSQRRRNNVIRWWFWKIILDREQRRD